MGWLIFVAGIVSAGAPMYAVARLIAGAARITLAVLALIAIPALVSAGFSGAVQGWVLVLSFAAAIGVEAALLLYGIRNGGRKHPQQYLS